MAWPATTLALALTSSSKLSRERLGLRSELQPLEHGHLVRELVDGGLLEGNLAPLTLQRLLRGAQGLAQLLRCQRVDEFVGDHGS
jgi:hypothetical protein